MGALLIGIAIVLGIFGRDVKTIKDYSFEIQSPKIAYELESKENTEKSKTLSYEPNVHSFTAVTLGTEYGSISLTTQNNDKDKEDLGKTRVFDFQILGFKDNYLWELHYQNYQGLFITQDDLSGNLPEANAWSYGISVKQFYSQDFDLKKSLSNFSFKKVSDWSWIRGLSFSKNKLFSEQGLIPNAYAGEFSEVAALNGIQTTNFGFDFGIGGTYISGGYFATGMVTLGMLLQEQVYDGLPDEDLLLTTSTSNFLIGLGYSFNKSHSLGLEARGATINIPLKDVKYNESRTVSSFYYKHFF